MALRPLKYGDTTISPQIKILKEYLYTVKIILNSDGTLKRDYDLTSTLYSEGTYIIERTMFLRPFLISKGH